MEKDLKDQFNLSGFLLNGRELTDHLDLISILAGHGTRSVNRELQYIGFNHRQIQPLKVDFAQSGHIHIFFTRPILNLSEPNCLRTRELAKLITNNRKSINHWVRITLDLITGQDEKVLGRDCPLVDNENPFIPMLSNSLVNLSGVPDVAMSSYTTEKGMFGEVFAMVDSLVHKYDKYSLNTSFVNMEGEPVSTLLHTWMSYAARQYIGDVKPRFYDILTNRMNYTSRIYVLKTDHTGKTVRQWWCNHYCYPATNNFGKAFEYQRDKPINFEDAQQISVQWESVGSFFNDMLHIAQFNTIVEMTCPSMRIGRRREEMIRIPLPDLTEMNYYGLPRINPETLELEWWMKKEIYNKSKAYLRTEQASKLATPIAPHLEEHYLAKKFSEGQDINSKEFGVPSFNDTIELNNQAIFEGSKQTEAERRGNAIMDATNNARTGNTPTLNKLREHQARLAEERRRIKEIRDREARVFSPNKDPSSNG